MNANKRTQSNIVIDTIGYLAFWVLVSTGIMMKYTLLPGSRRGANSATSLMGLDRHTWGDVHFWASMVFVTAIMLHLVLHWSWITGMFKKFLNVRPWGVVVPALVLPIVIAFIPMMGLRGFEVEKENSGKNRAGFSSRQNLEAQTTQIAQNTEQSGNFVPRAEGEGNDINGFKIRGRTTLQEIEEGTGVKAERIIAALNLPADFPRTERIATLMQTYGLEMERFRETVKRLVATE